MGEKHVKNPPEELILYNKKLILPIIVMSHDSELDSFLNWTFRDAISLRKKKEILNSFSNITYLVIGVR